MKPTKQSRKECIQYEDGFDTGGNPIMNIKCFCWTTACHNFPKVKTNYVCDDDIGILKEIDWINYHKALENI